VTGFDHAVEHVLAVEGGLVDHPDDPGGVTNMGISLRSYPELGRAGIVNLTRADAIEIYHRDFWTPIAERVQDDRLRFCAFDAAVNHGLSRALRWLRDHPSVEAFTAHRLRFYARLQTFTTFGRGWVRRMASVTAVLADMPNPIIDADRLFLRQADGTFDVHELDADRPARLVGDKLYANLPIR
jgi:lysozyme family protein